MNSQLLSISKYILTFILGVALGCTYISLNQPKKPEVVDVNYDSICLRTLKAYYLQQDQEQKKKLIKSAGKEIALDRMMSD